MNENLLKAGTLLAGKIQWLLDNNKIAEKQIDDYNKIIELIEKGSQQNEMYIKELKQNNIEFSLNRFHLQEKIVRLEAICLFHGILNINYMLNKQGIIAEAKNALKSHEFQLPYVFTQKLNKIAVYDTKN